MSETWYLATCHACTPVLPQPFADEQERDQWATAHHTGTGHVVTQAVEQRPVTDRAGRARSQPADAWWLCPNEPRHGAVLHDIEELADPKPMCCVEGCTCGHTDGRSGDLRLVNLVPVDESEDTW